jgi:hypothetical protein
LERLAHLIELLDGKESTTFVSMQKEKVVWVITTLVILILVTYVSVNLSFPTSWLSWIPGKYPLLIPLGLKLVFVFLMVKPRLPMKIKKVLYLFFAIEFSIFALQSCLTKNNGLPLLLLGFAWLFLYLSFLTSRRLS